MPQLPLAFTLPTLFSIYISMIYHPNSKNDLELENIISLFLTLLSFMISLFFFLSFSFFYILCSIKVGRISIKTWPADIETDKDYSFSISLSVENFLVGAVKGIDFILSIYGINSLENYTMWLLCSTNLNKALAII